jgi:predicted Holliday junction resolvase-like endonuclease
MKEYYPLILFCLSIILGLVTFLSSFIFWQIITDLKLLKSKDDEKEKRIQKLEDLQGHKVDELIKKIDKVEDDLQKLSEYVHNKKHDANDIIQQFSGMMTTINSAMRDHVLIINPHINQH